MLKQLVRSCALLLVELEHLGNEVAELRAPLLLVLVGQARWLPNRRHEHALDWRVLLGRLPVGHLQHANASGPNVGRRVVLLLQDHLGWDPVRAAHHPLAVGSHVAAKAKINELYGPICCHHDVSALHVTMDDALRMQEFQPFQALTGNIGNLALFKDAGLHGLSKSTSIHKLHGNPDFVLDLECAKVFHNVVVNTIFQPINFVDISSLFLGSLVGQLLDGNLLWFPREILGLIHTSKSSFSSSLDYLEKLPGILVPIDQLLSHGVNGHVSIGSCNWVTWNSIPVCINVHRSREIDGN
mmetsp:Transcript_51636/g.129562  ORF Transcript_51636/g.129562 Transcript_51636/m.129562 type:complete len:298 (-) Transcript_51636:445-1338(-)